MKKNIIVTDTELLAKALNLLGHHYGMEGGLLVVHEDGTLTVDCGRKGSGDGEGIVHRYQLVLRRLPNESY